MHAKGSGAFGELTITADITRYTKAKLFSQVGKKTPLFLRFSTVGGEAGSADTERDPRGFALKFYTEQGIWDIVGNNTPVFFLRESVEVPRLHPHAEAAPANAHQERDDAVGLLVPSPRIIASGDDPVLGSRHPRRLSLHGRLREPHLQHDQREGRALLRQVSLQDEAGHQESPPVEGARARGLRPPTTRSAISSRRSSERNFLAGRCPSRSCPKPMPRSTR